MPRDVTREKWSHKRDYILAQLGLSIGLGTFWRFPYMSNRNGGGAFLIPYFGSIIVLSVPLFFLEVSISQFSKRSSMHVWALCPLFKGIGICQAAITFVGGINYNVVIGWVIYYFILSFSSILPWTSCGNWWNTFLCITNLGNSSSVADHGNTTAHRVLAFASPWRKPNATLTAMEEFWQYNALRISPGLDSFGSMQLHLVGCAFGSWFLIFICLMKGIKAVGKVVYLTVFLPYILLVVLLVRSCMMPGAADGVKYFLKPDFDTLRSTQVWLEALMQGLYSLSLINGSVITMASYNKFNNNFLWDVIFVNIMSEASSLLCGFVVFSTLGYMAAESGTPISEVVSSGPGLGFIIYPEALSLLPVPSVWAVIFFLMLISIGVDSTFALVENVIAAVTDAFPRHLTQNRMMVTGGVCLVCFLMSLLYTVQAGVYIFQLVDWYLAAFVILLIAFLEPFVVCWLYGSQRYNEDVKMMLGRDIPKVLLISLKFITPGVMLVSLVAALVSFQSPTYGEYQYPSYARNIGICIAAFMIIPIVFGFLHTMAGGHGSIYQRLKQGIVPDPVWKANMDVDDSSETGVPLRSISQHDLNTQM